MKFEELNRYSQWCAEHNQEETQTPVEQKEQQLIDAVNDFGILADFLADPEQFPCPIINNLLSQTRAFTVQKEYRLAEQNRIDQLGRTMIYANTVFANANGSKYETPTLVYGQHYSVRCREALTQNDYQTLKTFLHDIVIAHCLVFLEGDESVVLGSYLNNTAPEITQEASQYLHMIEQTFLTEFQRQATEAGIQSVHPFNSPFVLNPLVKPLDPNHNLSRN